MDSFVAAISLIASSMSSLLTLLENLSLAYKKTRVLVRSDEIIIIVVVLQEPKKDVRWQGAYVH